MVENFDYVVIDGEAGIEQVNRRVMEKVTHLVLVSDASARGLNVARTIKKVSDHAAAYAYAGLVLNRVRGEAEFVNIRVPEEIPLLGWIPDDDVIRMADIAGASLLDIADCPATEALRACLKKLCRLCKKSNICVTRNFRRISCTLAYAQFFKNCASLDLEFFTKPSETDFLRIHQL